MKKQVNKTPLTAPVVIVQEAAPAAAPSAPATGGLANATTAIATAVTATATIHTVHKAGQTAENTSMRADALAPLPPPNAPTVAACWYPDPQGIAEQRYHDVFQWTDQVNGAAQVLPPPLPATPALPVPPAAPLQ